MSDAMVIWLPLMALGLDVVLGDPCALPHPVQAVGWALNRLERIARPCHVSKLSGALCLAVLLIAVGLTVWSLTAIPVLGVFLALYFAWSGLALGSLLHECRSAATLVAEQDLEAGRAAVSMLVSRDLSQAEQSDLYRALGETLSENFNDGFVAPFFWLVLGGPLGLWLYKAVSTTDSMWGYKTEQWRELGWAGARLDDVLAYVPARLSAFLLALSAPLAGVGAGMSVFRLWRHVASDAAQMESPNAGWPMAMAAWLHRRSMGGTTWYFGQAKDKPLLGPRRLGDETVAYGRQWDAAGIDALLRHVRIAAVLGGVLLWLVTLL
ncbi:adenosylcobinamide-phosphate synthase CbiB [Desulfovibrio mangrovi]|uniref:adenosylcobinamide-phosphate synthase CbiB n=1 Tax=Desulfovibrio mangrovi TaxID=2976983 RepID=UPI0022454816|nr:adenosylcobinamide-phosphate synthase CbiB [Desulfovibrio mangrovi]UZP68654.1 adenosylcobinamide-phosphate synthase CbiB [Desulfovibrio mangrovi]